jgi:hypothetical protein
MINKNTPSDYDKVGAAPKLRPIDVTSRARFFGERTAASDKVPADFIGRLMWAHVFRRFATNPAFLQHASAYWPLEAKIVDKAEKARLSLPLAKQVCRQQGLFAAHRFRAQYLYTSLDHTKQSWRTDSYVPLPRLLPILGHGVAEDLAASVLVDGWWSANIETGNKDAEVNPLDDDAVRAIRSFVADSVRLHGENADVFLNRVVDSAKVALPALSEKEKMWTPRSLTPHDNAAATTDAAVPTVDTAADSESEEASAAA